MGKITLWETKKRTGNSPFLFGKFTISMAMFNSKLLTSPEGMIYDNPLAFGASNFQRPRKFTSNLALVGGFNHLEKYWSMGRIIPYIMEKNV